MSAQFYEVVGYVTDGTVVGIGYNVPTAESVVALGQLTIFEGALITLSTDLSSS